MQATPSDTSPSKLPILLLVFSTEEKKNRDGSKNEEHLDGVLKEKDAIVKAIEIANTQLNDPICEYIILEGKEANFDNIIDKFNKNEDRIVAFHYAGHAGESKLLLQDEDGKSKNAYAGGLITFFRRQSSLKLIFLNGCETHQQAKDIYDQGIPTVIGTNCLINDQLAKEFAHRFYRSLAAGVSLEKAWEHANNKLQAEHNDKPEIQIDRNLRGIKLEGAEGIRSWDFHSQSLDWNLGSAAKNPLFGLPPPVKRKLPEVPFLYLERYQKEHAGIFFGRGREIRHLFSLLIAEQSPPLILFHGQSGVGKSSVLEAGLLPRLEGLKEKRKNRIVVARRDHKTGLLTTLVSALNKKANGSSHHLSSDASGSKDQRWQQVRKLLKKLVPIDNPVVKQEPLATLGPGEPPNPFYEKVPKLVIILDQAEESFTRPLAGKRNVIQEEWKQLLTVLLQLQTDPDYSTTVKVILSFRKEYFSEITTYCEEFGLNWKDVFLEPLNMQGIQEVIRGISATGPPSLYQEYGVKVEEKKDKQGNSIIISLPEDLLEDQYSPISPILQIYLSRMWEKEKEKEEKEPAYRKIFNYIHYQEVKKEIGGKLEEFFEQQLKKLEEEQKGKPLAPYIEAGLVLDLLERHTTKNGTAGACDFQKLCEEYIHEGIEIKDLLELIEPIENNSEEIDIRKKDLQTLIDRNARKKATSKKDGLSEEKQQAVVKTKDLIALIKKHKNQNDISKEDLQELINNAEKQKGLSPRDLKKLIEALVNLRLLLRPNKKTSRLAHDTLAPIVLKTFATSQRPGQQAAHLLKSKAPFFAVQEEQADQEPQVDSSENEPEKASSQVSIKKIIISALSFIKRHFLNLQKGYQNLRQDGLNKKIKTWKNLVFDSFHTFLREMKEELKGKVDTDPKRIEPASLNIIEQGALGMRKWTKAEQALVNYNREIQNKGIKSKQAIRAAIISLAMVIGGLVFLWLVNSSEIENKDNHLAAYRYMTQATEEQEQGNQQKALALAAQAYLTHFPKKDPIILESLITRQEDAVSPTGALIAIDTIELKEELDQVDISPDGRYALNWGADRANLFSLGTGNDQARIQEFDTLITATFSAKGSFLGTAKKLREGGGVVEIRNLRSDTVISKVFPYEIVSMDFARDTQRIAIGTADKTLLIWNYQEDKIESTLSHSAGSRIESIKWSNDNQAIWTKVSELGKQGSFFYMDDNLWHYSDDWKEMKMSRLSWFVDFSPEGKFFLKDDGDDVYHFMDASGSQPDKLSNLQIPGYNITSAQFNTQGDIILNVSKHNQAWVLRGDENPVPIDVFEFNNPLKLIKEDTESGDLFFLTTKGEIYQALAGKSPLRWLEEQNFSLDQTQTLSEILPKYFQQLKTHLWWLNVLGFLSLIWFFIHIVLFSPPRWLLWLQMALILILLARSCCYVVDNLPDLKNLFKFSLESLQDWAALTLVFNLHQIWVNFQRGGRQGDYRPFYIWLFIFLVWIVALGRFYYELPDVFRDYWVY